MSRDYAQALAEFGALVDRSTGVIAAVELLKLSEIDPVVYMAHAEPCDTTPLAGLPAANRGAACSVSPERAVVRACGESVERYCSAIFDIASLCLGSDDELTAEGRQLVRPEELYPFAEWQYSEPGFPYQPSRGRKLRWTEGTSVVSGQKWLVPASCVYVPYLFDAAVEPFTHMPISTGLAAGQSIADCVAKGILEILERDALMVVWRNRLAMPRLMPESCFGQSPLVDRLLSTGSSGTSSWFLNVLTLDIEVTIISAALIDSGSPPLTSFGISASIDPVRALVLALEEATLTRVLLNRMEEARCERDYDSVAIRTLHDHLLAHATSGQLRKRLEFLTDAGMEQTLAELITRARANDRSLAERIAAAGLDAVSVDLTTDDIADFGFRVVRTVMPGLQPLDNDHRYRHLGGSRLQTVPAALGLSCGLPSSYNDDPHPFP